MHLFYTPDIAAEIYTLPEEESKHAVKVLRLEEGETVQLIDGRGGFYNAVIADAHPKRTQLQVVQKTDNYGKRSFYIHIAVAPTKNIDRLEWFVEKAVEIGIDEISFLLCDHSERKVLKLDRLEKIAISAMKQSYKAYLPKLNELVPFKSFVHNTNPEETFIAHLEEDARLSLKQSFKPNSSTCILIGPEGDFSAAEIALAKEAGIRAVTLGQSRLRTETAALVACHTLHVLQDVFSD